MATNFASRWENEKYKIYLHRTEFELFRFESERTLQWCPQSRRFAVLPDRTMGQKFLRRRCHTRSPSQSRTHRPEQESGIRTFSFQPDSSWRSFTMEASKKNEIFSWQNARSVDFKTGINWFQEKRESWNDVHVEKDKLESRMTLKSSKVTSVENNTK